MTDYEKKLLELYEEKELYESYKAGCINKLSEINKAIKKLKDEQIEKVRAGKYEREESKGNGK